MQNLNSQIDSVIKTSFQKFSLAFAKKFSLPVKDVISFWKELSSSDLCKESTKKVCTSEEDDDSEEESEEKVVLEKKQKEKRKVGSLCIHIFERGPRKGTECGDKACKRSQTGEYCGKHLSHENKPKKEVIVKELKEKKSLKKDPEVQVVIRKNKYGNYVHDVTGLVFKIKDCSQKKKVVIGVQNSEGDIFNLSEYDVQNCKKYRFIIDDEAKKNINKKPLSSILDDEETKKSDEEEEIKFRKIPYKKDNDFQDDSDCEEKTYSSDEE